jgi:hypothetical protein
MAAQNDHLKNLHAARMQAVKGRREVADILTENFRRGHTEDVRDQTSNPTSASGIETVLPSKIRAPHQRIP